MSKADNAKNANMAKRMKEQGITRTTTNCPVGCGATIPIPVNLTKHKCKSFKRDRAKYKV